MITQPTLEKFRGRRMDPDSTLGDYWAAPCEEGNQAYNWSDKPHRLLYDLIGEVMHLRAEIEQLKNKAIETRLEQQSRAPGSITLVDIVL